MLKMVKRRKTKRLRTNAVFSHSFWLILLCGRPNGTIVVVCLMGDEDFGKGLFVEKIIFCDFLKVLHGL